MKTAPEIEWNCDVWSERKSPASDFTTLMFYRHQLRDRQYAFIYWLDGRQTYRLVSDFKDVTQHFVHHQAELHDKTLWSWRRNDMLGAESLPQATTYPDEVWAQMLAILKEGGWNTYGLLEDRERKRFILNR